MRAIFRVAALALALAAGAWAADKGKPGSTSGGSQKYLKGYYPNWSQYAGFTADKLPYEYLTHILYAFYLTDPAGNIANSDPLDEANFRNLVKLAHAKGVKVLLSIGGYGQSEAFKPMAAGKGSRANFIRNCLKVADELKLDGIDLDWEYPDTTVHGENQLLLHREIRAAFDKHPRKLIFSAAVPGSEWWARWSKDEAFQLLDYLNVMTYDYMGGWEKHVIPNSGMDLSIQALEYYEKRGIPKSKLVIGAAFYGKSFDGGTGMGSTYTGLGSGANGVWQWKDMLKQFQDVPYKIYWDEKTQSEFALGNDEIIVFNGLPSQRVRGEFVRNSEYPGVMFWDMLGDVQERDKSLLVALYRGLRGTNKTPLVTPTVGPKWEVTAAPPAP